MVMAHNNWSGYLDGQRWSIIFDMAPAAGHRFLMDGLPGWIHSGDDFGVNAAGMAITETTITRFEGFDPKGIPEFVRARKAMQYSASIDDFASIMKTGNNGGYANNWLVADRKTNEIASLELGLRNVNLKRTTDGYFLGTNRPEDEKLLHEETTFDTGDLGLSANARRVRAIELLETNKGKVDVAVGKKYLSDHYDSFAKKEAPSERTLCGHVDLSSRGLKPWQPEYGPAGAVQSKVMDAAMASAMSFEAALGHACGIDFLAAEHIRKHPEFGWQKGLLRDIKSHPWTGFRASF
ncbi:MAG TPA: C45 family autoproteolytic acyltransferase/hydrolase, partial [Bryobacteraceae bacterium]|nr:C45 family autoproteolytic acyltransferase/hydrolase [Bryobacteraceae bacterium]